MIGEVNGGDVAPSASIPTPDLSNGNAKECPHKNKKSLFKSSEVRKKLKSNLKKNIATGVCEDCIHLAIQPPHPGVWLCVSCGYAGCEEQQHALKHCNAVRSGAEHPLFLSITTKTFRCFTCQVNATEEGSQPMKSFLNEYNSFIKTKSKSADQLTVKSKRTVSPAESNPELSTSDRGTLTKKDKKHTDKMSLGGTCKQSKKDAFVPVKGLVNLGNTCFFNSITQCMLHTHSLYLYIEQVGKHNSVDIPNMKVLVADSSVQVPQTHLELEHFNGPLNERFAYFLRDFRTGRNVHPSSLFSEIAKKAPRFRGWAQQDAHELLRYLLDGLRSEESTRFKEAISDHLKLAKNANPRSVEPALVALAKGMLKGCGRPLLDAVFGGTLLQTVKCSKCNHLSRMFEDMLDLSLPLPSTSSRSIFIGASRMHKSASAGLSKHQKKKEKANARKRNRRKSHGESVSVEGTESRSGEMDLNDDLDVPNIDDDDDDADAHHDDNASPKDVCEGMASLEIDGDEDECSLLLGDAPSEESGWTLTACLKAFTATETLSAPNTYECEKCCLPFNKKMCNGMKKKSVEASKRYLIYEPPAVLTLHFKRFEQTHSASGRISTRKVSGHITFPAIFDLAPFCTRIAKRVADGCREVIYSLYGVVSHSGDLSGGHYVAYIRSRPQSPHSRHFFEQTIGRSAPPPDSNQNESSSWESNEGEGEWYYASDTRVSVVPESRVLGAEAYVLFYERVA